MLPRTAGSAVRRAISLHTSAPKRDAFQTKYAADLLRIAQQKNKTVPDLFQQLKEEKQKAISQQSNAIDAKKYQTQPNLTKPEARPHSKLPLPNSRRDSSPFKPLSSILNVSKIIATPHTAEQISSLWTAYHLSRSEGTGRGHVCATIPVALYDKMAGIAATYPSFIVPIPRPMEEGKTGHEFFYMQWSFHGAPTVPSAAEIDPFVKPESPIPPSKNPQTTTVLFAPLGEYKLRGTFATPYLVLTHYTDLAHSHGTVLLRGEITPSAASSGGTPTGGHLLTQEDAQLLAMGLQKFYLWDADSPGGEQGGKLLKSFHEMPGEFKWEELVDFSNLTF